MYVQFSDDPNEVLSDCGPDDWPRGTQASPTMPAIGAQMLDPSHEGPFHPESLTSYFRTISRDNFTMYGDEFEYVTDHPESFYLTPNGTTSYTFDYGLVSHEILTKLVNPTVPPFANLLTYTTLIGNQHRLNHLFVVLRSRRTTFNSRPVFFAGATGTSGVSSLGNLPVSSYSYNGSTSVTVFPGPDGSFNLFQTIDPLRDTANLLAHEIGHDIWGPHLFPVLGNSLPELPPLGTSLSTGDRTPAFALMLGGDAGPGFPQDKILVKSFATASERAFLNRSVSNPLLKWIDCISITTSSQTYTSYTLGDIDIADGCFTLPISNGSPTIPARFYELVFSNVQRSTPFNELRTLQSTLGPDCPGCQVIEQGSPAPGMMIEVVDRINIPGGLWTRDLLPADNRLSSFQGCDIQTNTGQTLDQVYGGDLWRPGLDRQLTPWTRPSIYGYGSLDAIPAARRTQMLASNGLMAIDDIRSGSGTDIVFDFHANFPAQPVAHVRKDWFVTAATNGLAVFNELRVQNGAELHIEQGAEATFNGDLVVEAGGILHLSGGTLRFAPGKRLRVLGHLASATGTLTASNTAQGWSGLRFEPGSTSGITDITLAGDLVILAGATLNLSGATLRFGQGKKLSVYGQLNSTTSTLTASNAAQGWGGLRFEEGSTGLLNGGSIVERVVGYGGSSIYAYKASLTLDQAFVRLPGGYGMTGVYFSNAPTTGGHFIRNETEILNHPGDGVRAVNGASVFVQNSFINGNGDGLSVSNASIFSYKNTIENQSAYGTEATYFGNVVFGFPTSGYPTYPGDNNILQQNVIGDLRATSYAAISAGDASSFRNNRLIRHTNNTGLHAYGRTYSDVTAQYDWWGQVSGPNLAYVDTDATSTFVFCPYLTAPGGTSTGGSCLGAAKVLTSGELQAATSARGPLGQASAPFAERLRSAREALNAGNTSAAVAEALAVGQADVDEETQRTAVVLLTLASHREPASGAAIQALEALVSRARPIEYLALRALASLHIAQGRPEAVRHEADRLIRLTSESDAAAGYALLALAELESRETDAVLAALAALARADAALGVARDGDAEFVEAVRTEIALREGVTLTPRSGGIAGNERDAASEKSSPAEAASLDTPRPNPSWGTVELGLTLPAQADVDIAVYDVLGRQVATLTEGPLGAGIHLFTTTSEELPPGVYVIRAMIRGPSGSETLSRTFTLLR